MAGLKCSCFLWTAAGRPEEVEEIDDRAFCGASKLFPLVGSVEDVTAFGRRLPNFGDWVVSEIAFLHCPIECPFHNTHCIVLRGRTPGLVLEPLGQVEFSHLPDSEPFAGRFYKRLEVMEMLGVGVRLFVLLAPVQIRLS